MSGRGVLFFAERDREGNFPRFGFGIFASRDGFVLVVAGFLVGFERAAVGGGTPRP